MAEKIQTSVVGNKKKTTAKLPTKTEKLNDQRKRMVKVLDELKRLYPGAECSLTHENPFQLLAATILSAQCTDERVNMTTPALFKKFPDARSMSKAKLEDVEVLVKSTGFYRSKAKALVEMSRSLVDQYGGEVPNDLEKLTKLRGVGRKTANVVLGNVFGVPGLVVDTHVGRLSRRLGFTKKTDPVDVEFEMMDIVPKEDWTILAHLFIYHGRAVCDARKPKCPECTLAPVCPKIGVSEVSKK